MSWYDDAANEVGVAILAKDGPIVGPREVAAIIAAHDPNRWIPVEERLRQGQEFDESGNPTLIVEAFPNEDGEAFIAPFGNGKFLVFSEFYDDDWIPLDRQPTHWREIVLPEVKA